MPNLKELEKNIIRSLLRKEWLILYGPRGIGKSKIVQDVYEHFFSEYKKTHLPLILSFAKVKASSVEEVEKGVLQRISKHANLDKPDGVDFHDRILNLLERVQKQIVLFLTDVDIVSSEGAQHISKELSKLYHQCQENLRLTVMMSGGMRLSRLAFGKTSPFSKVKPIRVDGIDILEAKRWINSMNPLISDEIIEFFYNETGGYPKFLEEVIKCFSKILPDESPITVEERYLSKVINRKGEIKSKLINYWFSHINRPEFLFIIKNLIKDKPISVRSSQLSKEIIELSGFLKVEKGYVKFRNPLIKKFTQRYATPKRLADHFWIFSSQYENCWREGCDIYSSLSEEDRKRKSAEVIGPIYRRLSDLIISCGIFMTRKKSEKEILEVLDSILKYLFNCQKYFVCQRLNLDNFFSIYFSPKESSFFVGDNVNDSEKIGLIERCLREKREWAHSWHYSYIAFPLLRGHQRKLVLWIDNRCGKITKDQDRDLALLASNTGLAILQLEQKEYLSNQLNLLQVALEYDHDYVQVIDINKNILMLNRRSEEDAKKRHPQIENFIGQNCQDIFLEGKCSKQCACEAVFRDEKPHRHPETWPDPLNQEEVRYMDVMAFPLKKEEQMIGVLQIARDVSLLRRAMETMIDFSSARTEEEVFSLLLRSLSRQGAKRVRLYMPSDIWEVNNKVEGNLISKDCIGYDNDPEFVKKFRSGKILLDGRIETYWYDAQKQSKKPIISRINKKLQKPKISIENRSIIIFEVPPEFDTCRELVKKKNTDEWICMGLFAGGRFFGLVSVDKGAKGGKFSIIECDRMLGICRSAASTIGRISVPNIRKVIRVFRHSVSQQLDTINQYIWAIAEVDLPRSKRVLYAKLVDDEFQRFELFSRNMSALLPEMGKVPISPKKLNFPKMLKGIQNLFHYYCDKCSIDLKIECSAERINSIKSDEMVIRIILYNLLDNAFKSLEKWSREKIIYVKCHNVNKDVFISVIDTGPGIVTEDIPHIFDPGFSRREGRTGIGLPASKIVADWINGNITYDQDYCEGAKFDLLLPNLEQKINLR